MMARRARWEVITGDEIKIGDLIKSAAMRYPVEVEYIRLSRTAHTVEINDQYRIGRTSKVRREIEGDL